MLHLFALTTFISSVLSQEFLGVNYSFNEDFNIYFDNRTCHSDGKWYLIEYQTLKVFSSNTENNNGIISTNYSCVSSFAIVFFLNSVLEVTVYVRLSSLKSGLLVTVFDELETPVVIYAYNKSSEDYTPGWNTLHIVINKNITGYLNLQGRIAGNEIIIIDSFKHVVKTKHRDEEVLWNSSTIDKSESLLLENLQLPRDIIDEWRDNKDGSGSDNENGSGDDGSGDIDGDINSTTPSDIDISDTPAFQFWNHWTITLVAVGSFVLVSIMIVIAYYIGKRRGQDDNAAMIERLEPQRTLRLPRINSFYSGFRLNRFR